MCIRDRIGGTLVGQHAIIKDFVTCHEGVVIGDRCRIGQGATPVSYTHLDVYKRQPVSCSEMVKLTEADKRTVIQTLQERCV